MGQIAQALAAFIRAQASLPLAAVEVDAECLDRASQLLAVLGLAPTPARKQRRGRPRRYDWPWAESCLLNLTLEDPDGLPPLQRDTVDRLRASFEADGRAPPSDPSLKKFVAQFYGKINIREQTLKEKYRSSDALQRQFGDEESYVRHALIRHGLAEKWARNKDLQMRYADPHAYIETMIEQYLVAP